MTPVQEAFVALGDHGVRCPACKPVWVGDIPIHRPCTVADRLYRQWRERFRARGAR